MAASPAHSQPSRAGHTADNRRAKRDQIIEAARDVLARDGVAACTARAVADASPLTKSAIHYYFRDVDEIIDQAMAAHVNAMLTSLRDVAGQPAGPHDRLWAVISAYLATFADKPHAAFLWFEYWVTASRRHSLDRASQMLADVEALFRGLLEDMPVDNPGQTAHLLLSWLLGTIVQQHTRPTSAAALHGELTRILGNRPASPHT
ncbi:MAG TPA: TetR family transcriptional regulator [Streptosporangiaceae bacterium]|nr:TetR family transcriptional regulator [Streptosporangiaceae bacterium]